MSINHSQSRKQFSVFRKLNATEKRFSSERADSGLESLITGATDFLDAIEIEGDPLSSDGKKAFWDSVERSYQKAEKMASTLAYALDDVEPLAMIIREQVSGSKSEYAGLFISALLNRKMTESSEIRIAGAKETGFIGYNLAKGRIIIESVAGRFTGCGMNGGSILVDGYCRDYAGSRMSGGELNIKESACSWLAMNATGGRITVEKDCSSLAAYEMDGASIHIKGDGGIMLGNYMKSGDVICDNDCADHLGEHMSGGKISIAKNAKNYVGLSMSGGSIIIGWHAGDYVGYGNNGGNITVGGTIKPENFATLMEKGRIDICDAWNQTENAPIPNQPKGGAILFRGELIYGRI